jgi:hypothetical protein
MLEHSIPGMSHAEARRREGPLQERVLSSGLWRPCMDHHAVVDYEGGRNPGFAPLTRGYYGGTALRFADSISDAGRAKQAAYGGVISSTW